jgi:hypothetical protein
MKKVVSLRITLFYGVLLVVSPWAAIAQSHSDTTGNIPLPDPGYGLFYHDTQEAPDFAARWGYHDGWTDGRRDRNLGESGAAEETGRFKSPPDHNKSVGLTRDQYVRGYRQAYVRGYSQGMRL